MKSHFDKKADKGWELSNGFKKGVVRIWTKIGEYDKQSKEKKLEIWLVSHLFFWWVAIWLGLVCFDVVVPLFGRTHQNTSDYYVYKEGVWFTIVH